MKRYTLWFAAVLCLLLGGCSWMDGSYVSTTPHHVQISGSQTGSLSASNFEQLREVLTELVENGTQNAVINISEFDPTLVETSMETLISYICERTPLGAYAVDKIEYDIGTGGGKPAISVNLSYFHGRSEIRNIQAAQNMDEAETLIQNALADCSESIVLRINGYSQTDLVQMIEDYAEQKPNIVMEVPQVAVGIYPDTGTERIVELKFTYQTSRDALRQMQTQVQRVFVSALLYLNTEDADAQKYAQLYAFLSERFDYEIETSITPSYSLLAHGVGDSEAFATVFAAMCRQAGLECQIISGTKDAKAWHWNLIREGENYYHVDLLSSNQLGRFTRLLDAEMEGYVWDYSAYPSTEKRAEEETVTE